MIHARVCEKKFEPFFFPAATPYKFIFSLKIKFCEPVAQF